MKEEKYIKRKIKKIIAREERWEFFFSACVKVGFALWFMIWTLIVLELLK